MSSIVFEPFLKLPVLKPNLEHILLYLHIFICTLVLIAEILERRVPIQELLVFIHRIRISTCERTKLEHIEYLYLLRFRWYQTT